jgi:hypothetical protein
MTTVLEKLQRGERHWSAELAFRVAGLAMFGGCALSWRWNCRLVADPPHHEATPLEFLAAALVFLFLVGGIALTFEGPGLLRHVALPPRALL